MATEPQRGWGQTAEVKWLGRPAHVSWGLCTLPDPGCGTVPRLAGGRGGGLQGHLQLFIGNSYQAT